MLTEQPSLTAACSSRAAAAARHQSAHPRHGVTPPLCLGCSQGRGSSKGQRMGRALQSSRALGMEGNAQLRPLRALQQSLAAPGAFPLLQDGGLGNAAPPGPEAAEHRAGLRSCSQRAPLPCSEQEQGCGCNPPSVGASPRWAHLRPEPPCSCMAGRFVGEETARDQIITIVRTDKILFSKKKPTENPPRLTDSGDIHPFETRKHREGLFLEELSDGPLRV